MGWSGSETWNVRYWTEPWQTLGAISNSFVLAGLLLTLAIWRKWTLVTAFAIAILLHLALDFPLHADDAHRHFWPVTDWRFFSQVSYWDPDANGLIGASIETIFCFATSAILWMRFSRLWVRTMLMVILAAQIVLLSTQLL